MPEYTLNDYGLSPMDMQSLGISGEAMPGPMDQAGDYHQNQGDIWGQPYADIPASKGFDWSFFASEALRGFGKRKEQKNFAPSLQAGPTAKLQAGGHRAQYQPARVQDFSLQGLSGLIPRNPLVPR